MLEGLSPISEHCLPRMPRFRCVRVSPEHSRGWSRHQPHSCGHCHHLRLGLGERVLLKCQHGRSLRKTQIHHALEPAPRLTSARPLPPHGTNQHCHGLAFAHHPNSPLTIDRPRKVYRLITANSIELRVLERANAKRKLERVVRAFVRRPPTLLSTPPPHRWWHASGSRTRK